MRMQKLILIRDAIQMHICMYIIVGDGYHVKIDNDTKGRRSFINCNIAIKI